MLAVGIAIGLAVGALLAWALLDARWRSIRAGLQTATALADERQQQSARQLETESALTQSLRSELAQLQQSASAKAAQFESAQQNIAEQRRLLDDAQRQLREAFAGVSAEALSRNNEAFLHLARQRFETLSTEAAGSLDQRKAQIEAMVQPMRELLDKYQIRLTEIEKSRVESYGMLREQLGTLAETQRALNTQTGRLVTALSRPNVRGQWGEISLRRLVELAGLSNRCDFAVQESVRTDDGRLRPDMVIHLPGDCDLVIDCKTPLDAFLEAVAAPDAEIRRGHLQRHAQQVRARSRELAAKSYWQQFTRTPEFVVMFLPGEPFLYATVEYDPNLMEDSMKNRVIIATPTTLLALLKTVALGWQQRAISDNAEAIRKLGAELYERVGVLLEHTTKLGSSLTGAVRSYNSMLGSLEARVVVTARKMSELSDGAGKELIEPQPIETVPRPSDVALFAPPG